MTRKKIPPTLNVLSILIPLAFAFATDNTLAHEGHGFGSEVIYLWEDGAPGSEGQTAPERYIPRAEAVPGETPFVDPYHRISDIHNPSLTAFFPPEHLANGSSCIILPGGGHKYLVFDLEGTMIAKRLNEFGIAAFVLKSRLSKAKDSTYERDVHELADAQRSIRLVRSRAAEWGLDPKRIGFMGFSAGGEVACLSQLHYDAGDKENADPIERASSRPDYSVIVYGVTDAGAYPIPEDAPPAFIMICGDDKKPIEHALYYIELKKADIPAELHIYTNGGHGFGFDGRTPEWSLHPVANWDLRLKEWLTDMKFMREY